MKLSTLDTYLHQKLQDPQFKKQWEASEANYQVVRLLIQERIEKKMSQRKLAELAQTTQTVISRVENLSVNPSIGLLERMANALGKKLVVKLA